MRRRRFLVGRRASERRGATGRVPGSALVRYAPYCSSVTFSIQSTTLPSFTS